MTYTPPPFPEGLKPWRNIPSAKGLQRALKEAGFMRKGVTLSNMYGPLTQAGVRAFHKKYPRYGTPRDGAIGPKGWAKLHRLAYEPKPTPEDRSRPDYHTLDAEPSHDYNRTEYGGAVVNQRTKVLLLRAAIKFGAPFKLTQGSYSKGVAASAGTHDGGGVVDIGVTTWSTERRWLAVRALREAGFAAWLRTPAEGFAYHIHACAIGDQEMAPLAVDQVADYFEGKNGLRGHGPDTAPAAVGRPWPLWAERYRPKG